MAKYIEMERRIRITKNRVSKFKNPRVIAWHLTKLTNGYPTFTIGLFKEGSDWVRGPTYAYKEIYSYEGLIDLLAKMSEVLEITVDKFYMMGSTTYSDEKLRQDITSQFTHEKRLES